jgi:hypothetical protein
LKIGGLQTDQGAKFCRMSDGEIENDAPPDRTTHDDRHVER